MGLEAGTPIQEIKLDRVFIGSCTNSRIGDLRAAASVVDGRTVAGDVYAMVVPGSQQVKLQAEREGLDEVFKRAGFDWRGAGCSMCLGMNPDIAAPGERVASTSNRNFEGRQGRGARSHLVSPQMAAAAAIEGTSSTSEIGRQADDEGNRDDHRARVGAQPRRRRHRPDHPQAVPQAGRAHRLRRVSVLRLGEGARLGPAEATRSSSAGRNFGCGSSREHAPWALEDYGFQAIIAPSFADIFRSNCTKIGLLPVELAADDCAAIAEAGEAQVDLAAQEVRWPGGTARFEIDPEIKHRLLNGLDDIALTLARGTRSRPTSASASAPARSRRRCERPPGVAGLGRRQLRPRLRPPAELGARAARAAAPARRRGGARRRLRIRAGDRAAGGHGPARTRVRGRCRAVDGRARARRPRRPGHRPVPGPGRADAPRAGRRGVLERDLPLDP